MAVLKTEKPPSLPALSLGQGSLIHNIYRALLNTGRTYAAFQDQQLNDLMSQLTDHKTILDPMAGYGTLITACARSEHAHSAYCVELNPPAYLWQVFLHPENAGPLLAAISGLLDKRRHWPATSVLAECAEEWFSPESQRILESLWGLTQKTLSRLCPTARQTELLSLALLLPFVARFACFVNGELVTQPKKGGICVYRNWQLDFAEYLRVCTNRLEDISKHSRHSKHTIRLADCLSANLPANAFSAMITSPPYPNGRDYVTMFAPENAFLDLISQHLVAPEFRLPAPRLIGCPRVSEKDGHIKHTSADVRSPAARDFLDKIARYKTTNQAAYDIDIYYLPYYSNYFWSIEQAYANVAKALAPKFRGFIVVVNNTARKTVIPVAQAVEETWRHLGFEARIHDQRELAHVGGINPRVKGMNARHTEYIIEVSRS